MSDGEQEIVLISSDKQRFTVTKKVAEHSILIKKLIQDLADEDEDDEQMEIPIPNVRATVLQNVIKWAEYHKDDYYPTDLSDDISGSKPVDEWDKEFLQVDQEMLYEIILAANYLNIRPLLDGGCKVVAEMIRGKSPEEIRNVFNIPNDFTPEEEAAIKRENEWAEDR